jgi:hypothetical protein
MGMIFLLAKCGAAGTGGAPEERVAKEKGRKRKTSPERRGFFLFLL